MSIEFALIILLILQIQASYIADPPNFEKGTVTGNHRFWTKKIYGHYYVTRDKSLSHSDNFCNGDGGRYAVEFTTQYDYKILQNVAGSMLN